MRRTIAILIVFLLLPAASVLGLETPRILNFTPQGIVKNVRQARAVFSEPMVAFGDPRAAIPPFDIECSEKGEGRWADPTNWVFDFGRELPAGVECAFRLRDDVRSFSGAPLSGDREFVFSTGGPAVLLSIPHEGSEGIDEGQIFILKLDAAADPDSVIAHTGFYVPGIADRIGVRIVEGAERDAVLEANSWLLYGEPDRTRFLLIQSRQRFPSKTRVSLVWGKGVKTASGVAAEKDQVFHFETRRPFLAEFHCTRENARAGCIPLLPMALRFNAPLDPRQSVEAVLSGADGKTRKGALKYDENMIAIEGPFPEHSEFTLSIPEGLKDDAGRPLANARSFPLAVRTGDYPPLAKFAARFGILESNAEPALPVTIRNIEPQVRVKMKEIAGGKIFAIPPGRIEAIQPWLRKVAGARRGESILAGEPDAGEFTLPKIAAGSETEVIGIPFQRPGLYVVEIESAVLGSALLQSPRPMYVSAAALVTNLSVHFKRGRDSSLVWVTTLDAAAPVGGASVAVLDCSGKLVWEGKTDSEGIARIDTPLPEGSALPRCRYESDGYNAPAGALRDLGSGFLVTARTESDMSFVHSSWDDGIEPWRFKIPGEGWAGPLFFHTVFDRTLLRAGETVHMKHIARRRAMEGFSIPPADRLPRELVLRHSGSDQKYTIPLTWDPSGVSETEWPIPREAKLGTYVATIPEKGKKSAGSAPNAGEPPEEAGRGTRVSGTFRVEEFRVPILKGSIVPPAAPLVNAREAELDLAVRYLSGGGAGLLPVRLRSAVQPKGIRAFEGFEGFVFGSGRVTEGLFPGGSPMPEEDPEAGGEKGPKLTTRNLTLDASGSARAVVADLPEIDAPHDLSVELEFRDPNGEVQTVSSRVPLWNSKVLAGIRVENWTVSADALRIEAAVVDLSGRPVAGAPVKIDLYQRKVLSHRKRLVGGFYGYDHTVATERIATLCEGKTDEKGGLACEAASPVSGELILLAETLDDAGNRAFAQQSVWAAGKEDWWFEAADHDRIDLLPGKKRYEPGETAVFQVRMPFREATALVSVEREGVMETRVQRLSGREPLVEIPVKGNYAPNVFVSVLAVRGRTGGVQPTAMADLGKPAFRLGMAEINVGWRAHELRVTVASDKNVYEIREKARVKVRAVTAGGKAPPAGTEISLAAVDEGLLELTPNRSWQLLTAMMGRRGCEVRTATAQMQVVGKRHFGIKALPPGGGGGGQITRELFDTLLLWKGRVPLDERGEAEIEVPLNDSVTAFRIVAVASGGEGLFGTGETSIRSTRNLTVFSGLPPLVREGDKFSAGFTLRNGSPHPATLDVSARVALDPPPPPIKGISLSPGESREIAWEVTVPSGITELVWEIEASSGSLNDRLRVAQKVVPAVPLRVFQATLSRLEGDMILPVARPEDALPGGGVSFGARARLGDGLTGVRDYMRRYPFRCIEQRISVAISLRDQPLWERLAAELPAYLDRDGLAKYFPTMPHGDPVLTAYIVAVSEAAGWPLPDDLRARMASGLKRFASGSLPRPPRLPTADLTLRKLSAIEALSRIGEADPALLAAIDLNPKLWPTSALIDWVNILLNLPELPGRSERLAEADRMLKSRLAYQGTILSFTTGETDRLWWLMISNDVNAARLVLTALRLESWRSDLPKLVRGALARQRGGHWDLTTANAWGILAMEGFSEAFEKEPVTGATRADLDGRSHRIDWAADPDGGAALLPWPPEKSGLNVSHQGSGNPWITVQSLAAIPLKSPFSSGYTIRKQVSAVDRKAPDRWSRGDTVRVRIDVDAQADMTWVAVSDPIPSGASILGTGFGTDSRLLVTRGEAFSDLYPDYEERSFEAFRAYYQYVRAGAFRVEYTLRLNQAGTFQLPPTRVEALYSPEMMGEAPNPAFEVAP